MTMRSRIFEHLANHGVLYSHSVHEPASTALGTAEAERMPAHELAKTVVYRGPSGYGLAVVPADRYVDLEELARELGLGDIRLAHESELLELFPDCAVGAIPPLGHLFRMPTVVDVSVVSQKFMAFTAGTHRDVVRIGTEDFVRLVRPLTGFISVRESIAV